MKVIHALICFICHKDTLGKIAIKFESREETLPVHKECWDDRVTTNDVLPCFYCGLGISAVEKAELGFRSVFSEETGRVEFSYPLHQTCSVKIDMMFASVPGVKYKDGAWWSS